MRFTFVSLLALFAVANAQQPSPPPTPVPGTSMPRPASPATPAPTMTAPRTTPQRQRPTSPRTPPHGARAPRTITSGPSGPPILLPFPPLMPPVAGGLTSPTPFRPRDLTRPPRDLYRVRPGKPFNSQQNPFVGGYGGGYVGSGYSDPGYGAPEYQSAEQLPPAPAFGMLRLDVTPSTAQVFVDSYYAGTVADVDRRALTLVAGPHRIEIRAQHYDPVAFDVRIDPNDTIVYRDALDLMQPAAPRATGPRRIYVIPGCYAGNIAPRAERLPAGCNIKLVQVLE
jgi:hypothetical protein